MPTTPQADQDAYSRAWDSAYSNLLERFAASRESASEAVMDYEWHAEISELFNKLAAGLAVSATDAQLGAMARAVFERILHEHASFYAEDNWSGHHQGIRTAETRLNEQLEK